MNKNIIIIIGAYGSGKSEYAINYAWQLHQKNIAVTLVDLDVVNPYFRSRQVREDFARQDILVIAPDGEYTHADLPMLSPRIMGAVQDVSRQPVLDVGGDPAGCRTLARYVENINKRGYHLKVVINTRRPFTSDHQGIIKMLDSLEYTSRLKITELICNTNLMEYTDHDIVSEGIKIISGVAQERNLIFTEYLVMEKYEDKIPDGMLGKKRTLMQYYLNKPWEQSKVHGMI